MSVSSARRGEAHVADVGQRERAARDVERREAPGERGVDLARELRGQLEHREQLHVLHVRHHQATRRVHRHADVVRRLRTMLSTLLLPSSVH